MQDIRPQLHEFGLHISHERVRVSEDTASVLEVAAGDSVGVVFTQRNFVFNVLSPNSRL